MPQCVLCGNRCNVCTCRVSHSDDGDLVTMSQDRLHHRYSDVTKVEVRSFMSMVASAHELGIVPEPLGVVSKKPGGHGVINVGCVATFARR